ncbi:hypothetical protein [Schaalia cardiffensis]|nr:hypothetical protein [Schaalia cardiffensis]
MTNGSSGPLSNLLRVTLVVLLIVVCVHATLKLLIQMWQPLAILAAAIGVVTALVWMLLAWWHHKNDW